MDPKNCSTGGRNQQDLELQFQRLVVRRTYAGPADPTKIVDELPKRRAAATTYGPSLQAAA